MKYGGKISNIFLKGGHEESRIIHIKRGPQNSSTTPDLVKKPMHGGVVKYLGERFNGKDEE